MMKPVWLVGLIVLSLCTVASGNALADEDLVDQARALMKQKEYKKAFNLLSESATDERMEKPVFMLAIADAARLYAPTIEALNGGDQKQAEYFNASGMVYQMVMASKKADEIQKDLAELNLQLLKNEVYLTATAAKLDKAYEQVIRLGSVLASLWPKDPLGPSMIFDAGISTKDESIQLMALRMQVAMKIKEEIVYSFAANLEQSAEDGRGIEAALQHLKAGLEVLPDSLALLHKKSQLLIEMDRLDEARKTIARFDEKTQAIEQEAERARYTVFLGMLYDMIGEVKKAEQSYVWAIQHRPNDHLARYNLGLIYFVRGNEYMKQRNDLSVQEFEAKGQALKARATEEYQRARVHLEAAHELDEPEVSLMNTLVMIYNHLDDVDALIKMREDIRKVQKGEPIR